MSTQEKKRIYTFEEYIEVEKDTQKRWEYHFGEIYAMAGGSKQHNILTLNMAFQLRNATLDKGCQIFSENVKLELITGKQYVYPDVMLTCNAQDLKDNTDTMVRYPSLVVEVLSETTEAYDHSGKKLAYFGLDSLLYYVLVWQKKPMVEVFERLENSWNYRNYSPKEQQINFPLLDFSLNIAELYSGIA